jgi:hypothetical protein
MFIAMEISSNDVRWSPFPLKEFNAYFHRMRPSNDSCSHLESLRQKVRGQVDHVLKTWRDDVDTALTSEPEQEPEQKPPLVHSPRHDAESVFWLLWFLLARANPLGEAPVEKGSAEKKCYDAFCSTMLNHTVGAEDESREVLAGRSLEKHRRTLHPRFAHLGDMLYYMGRYFLIDPKTWSDYNKDHAYYFMETLLLGEILRNEGHLRLNITEPRPATDPMAAVRRLPVPVESRSLHSYAASLTQDIAVSCSVSSSGEKRKSAPTHRIALSPSDPA